MLYPQTDIIILFNNAIDSIVNNKMELNIDNVLNSMHLLNETKNSNNVNKDFKEYIKDLNERLIYFINSIRNNEIYKKAFHNNLLFLNELVNISNDLHPILVDIDVLDLKYYPEIKISNTDQLYLFKYLSNREDLINSSYIMKIITGDTTDVKINEKTSPRVEKIKREINENITTSKTFLIKAKEPSYENEATFLNKIIENSERIFPYQQDDDIDVEKNDSFIINKDFAYGCQTIIINIKPEFLEFSKKN